MKLFHQLEQIFKLRINANSEIIPYIKKLSEMGKFDEPKKIAAIALLLDRVGKLEDEAEAEKSIHEIAYNTTLPLTDPIQKEIDEGKQVQEETILQSIDSPMSGVAGQVTDEIVAENPPVEQTVPVVETTPTDPAQDTVQVEAAPNEPTTETPVNDNTVSEFTPQNITDTPDSTTTA